LAPLRCTGTVVPVRHASGSREYRNPPKLDFWLTAHR
jgi:hypothetical protein